MSIPDRGNVKNRLINAMSEPAFERFRPHLTPIELPVRCVLVEANERPDHIYFLESGLGSVVASSDDQESVEVGHIGFEGMSGAHLLLQTDTTPTRTFMQVAGNGLRIGVDEFLDIVERDVATKTLFLRYVHCSELQLAHSALANARYNVNERLARWLLMCDDRLDGGNLALTHEFLALMLGVRRSGVTNEIHILEGIKAIRATRGNIRILDRAKLLEIASGSYGIPEGEYNRLIGPLQSPKSVV
jgi:CRP-like cAMP-binding protein